MPRRRQFNTFMVYKDGFTPKELSLGTLCADPANPLMHRPFQVKLPNKETQPDEYDAQIYDRPPDIPYSGNFVLSNSLVAALKLVDLATFNTSFRRTQEVKLEGQKCVKRRLQDTERFLNEIALGGEEGRQWLKDRLAISHQDKWRQSFNGVPPEVWILSAVREVEKAHVELHESLSMGAGLGLKIPWFLEPVTAVISAIFGPGIFKARIEAKSKPKLLQETTHEDARVWAAQWEQLHVTYADELFEPGSGLDLKKVVKLRRLEDLGTSGTRTKRTDSGAGEEAGPGDVPEYRIIDQVRTSAMNCEDNVCDTPDELEMYQKQREQKMIAYGKYLEALKY